MEPFQFINNQVKVNSIFLNHVFSKYLDHYRGRIQRGAGIRTPFTPPPPPPPRKITKILGFLAILVRISWKITKLHKPAFNFGPLSAHQRNAIYLFGSSLPSIKKEKLVKVGPPLTKLSVSAHVIAASKPMIHNHHATFFFLKTDVFSCSLMKMPLKNILH